MPFRLLNPGKKAYETEAPSIDRFKVSNEDVHDSHKGEMFARFNVEEKITGMEVGYIEYSIFQGRPAIQVIFVYPRWRGRGIGELIIDKLVSIYGYKNIGWGMTTPAGTKLKEAMDRKYLSKNNQYTYLNYDTNRMIPVPEPVNRMLNEARTPQQVNDILKAQELVLAHNQGNGIAGRSDYLQCDQVADLMIQVLKSKGIPAKGVLGYSGEGSSHVWVEINGKRYDPTEQGCYLKPPKNDPKTGFYIHRGAKEAYEGDWEPELDDIVEFIGDFAKSMEFPQGKVHSYQLDKGTKGKVIGYIGKDLAIRLGQEPSTIPPGQAYDDYWAPKNKWRLVTRSNSGQEPPTDAPFPRVGSLESQFQSWAKSRGFPKVPPIEEVLPRVLGDYLIQPCAQKNEKWKARPQREVIGQEEAAEAVSAVLAQFNKLWREDQRQVGKVLPPDPYFESYPPKVKGAWVTGSTAAGRWLQNSDVDVWLQVSNLTHSGEKYADQDIKEYFMYRHYNEDEPNTVYALGKDRSIDVVIVPYSPEEQNYCSVKVKIEQDTDGDWKTSD